MRERRGPVRLPDPGASPSADSRLPTPEAAQIPSLEPSAAMRQQAAMHGTASASDRDQMEQAMEIAVAFYAEIFASAEGAGARAFVRERGLPDAMAKRVGIGFAPQSWSALRLRLRSAGISDRVGVTVGLLRHADVGDDCYDAIRGRIILPIRNAAGRAVALGARAFGSTGGPKYLNSPTTPIYRKSDVLFGFDIARSLKPRSMVLVEGYFDALALLGANVPAAAILGTSISATQSALLVERFPHVYVALDGDDAGFAASLRVAPDIVAAGGRARIVTMPSGTDPDVFLRDHGRDALLRVIADSRAWQSVALETRLRALNAL
jgi:DNA primase